MKIQIYGKPNCVFCERAKALLNNRKIEFEYFELGKHFNREYIIDHFPTMKTFPIILIDNRLVGGYTDLVEEASDPNFGTTLLQG
jgi:glutaredoxin